MNVQQEPTDSGDSAKTGVQARRLTHWPHSARLCKEELAIDRIEDHAVRILARGLRTQRLVAFVGAGASMAYGRLTWAGLMTSLYRQIDLLTKDSGWRKTQTTLWPNGLTDFLKDDDHPLKSQELSDAWQRWKKEFNPEKGGLGVPEGESTAESLGDATELQWATRFWLEDYQGFIHALVTALYPDLFGSKSEEKVRRSLLDLLDRDPKPSLLKRGLTGVIKILFDLELAEPRELRDLGPFVRSIDSALREQSAGVDSPVRQMALDWGIRRFVTTNYDREIERGLKQLGFAEWSASSPEVHANQYEILGFGRDDTGTALRFALEGPRRHAAVLHIHGDVKNAASLIVTESHYQQLYLEDHPRRDLVTNATFANFASNPMLFVGSDVNEDDVLRPMRHFMTGPGHRNDRMAVALFMATKPRAKRAQQKAQLLLKYGVYAIHIGNVTQAQSALGLENNKTLGDDWLHNLYTAWEDFRDATAIERTEPAATEDANKKAIERAAKLTNSRRKLKELVRPTHVEHVALAEHPELNFSEDLDKLRTVLCAEPEPVLEGFALARARALFEITTNRVMSSFLAAKLIYLRKRATQVIEDDSRLPSVYGPHSAIPLSLDDAPAIDSFDIRIPVHARHAVSLYREGCGGRFAAIDALAGTDFDEGLADLLTSVQQGPNFTNWRGRRVIVACAARGCGKGAQSDQLILQTPGTGERPCLAKLLRGLGGYTKAVTDKVEPWSVRPVVLHANLSFSNELGRVISQVAELLNAIADAADAARGHTPKSIEPSTDQLEMFERGLRRLATWRVRSHRLLIVLGNAGVLFDADGQAKNGQIRRVLRLLLSARFSQAPIDILMYAGESQMPAPLRSQQGAGLEVDASPRPSSGDAGPRDRRRLRRLDRLNIRSRAHDAQPMIVHALRRTLVSDFAAAYFPDLARALGWRREDEADLGPAKGSEADNLARGFYYALGGSRFAVTLVLALLDAFAAKDEKDCSRKAKDVRILLSGPPSGSAVETAIEVVLDTWAAWHLLGSELRPASLPSFDGCPQNLRDALRALTSPLTAAGWKLATELLWHLSAFSHPVEHEVLLVCPRVAQAVSAWRATQGGVSDPASLVEAQLELLVHWCLIFRIEPRALPNVQGVDLPAWQARRYRYAPHRHMQRHFLRLMGGRNVETTHWDPFTTTVYASLPDESPSLRPQVHATLTGVVRTLTDYPGTPARDAVAGLWSDPTNEPGSPEMLLRCDSIRAAYYLVRSTYSLGVVSHLSPDGAPGVADDGHMEHYRRLVRWITHAAQYWEEEFGVAAHAANDFDAAACGFRWAQLRPKPVPKGSWRPMGIFYPGELIWLYNECGVISLAQGKLQDAEQMLSLAEQCARMVEADDSGSLHTRIRIHTALVQIERGRPNRARHILQPIANRRTPQRASRAAAAGHLVSRAPRTYWRQLRTCAQPLRRCVAGTAPAWPLPRRRLCIDEQGRSRTRPAPGKRRQRCRDGGRGY